MKKNTIIRRLMSKIGKAILSNAALSSFQNAKDALDFQTLVKMDRWTREKRWVDNQTMDEIADELGIRKEQLSLYFRMHVGTSFIKWRRELRIKEAQRLLLEDKNIPTAIIGEAVGISDKSYFRRQFKEVTGLTPAAYRLKNQT
ncbi:MAG: AraC family transcriptional regulator [Bacteroidales bacterium]|nr:AraC family transcriptional regulator [Bacteroidales bacterium]